MTGPLLFARENYNAFYEKVPKWCPLYFLFCKGEQKR